MCDGRTCGGIVKPANVRVGVQVLMQDFFFPGYTVLTLPLIADVNYPYLGR
jgi:hypothetical protein